MKRKEPSTATHTKGRMGGKREYTKTLTPDQARSEYFPEMGRAAFYAALRRKEIPSLRLGRRILIPRAALDEFLKNYSLMTATGGNNAA